MLTKKQILEIKDHFEPSQDDLLFQGFVFLLT